ncbi:head scaffolding protein [Streptococcus phage CHPC1198]|uniref:Scaffolding protein n=8 Tax=Vansinderenvirus TaxID=3044850 RepID=A0A3S5H0G3_9CAUD|nr:head scaffolding protein [Streptococcus phage 5093]YP_010681853.1 head scaffolding protein [Streptococcus phage SW4]YP_010681946.1 head scaffolding protein [Streptococcus phage CHPC1198]YP_010681993.1 head scaffolding protein [Streptococcus phage P0093]YP_010682044.1 head scaffolding protein [Streptococcus phage SW24]YP_010682086.1 head scaffolding protein [Streptococcus phage P0092]YP_010682137.1 head scaffolding protein [Streptococcus phage CHPC1151]YP_010682182.1 head scaffolding prote
MSLKRDMLVEAGITDKSVIDNIMQAYGAGIENAKSQAKSELQAENESLKQQLEQQSQALNDLQAKEGASEELKQQLTDLQAKFDTYKSEYEANLAKVTKSNAIRLALKDVNAHNSDDLAKFINFDEIELDEAGKPKLDKVVEELKTTSPYLFKQEEQASQPKIFAGGNPTASQSGLTKEDFRRMGINERQALFDKDPELYQKLKG